MTLCRHDDSVLPRTCRDPSVRSQEDTRVLLRHRRRDLQASAPLLMNYCPWSSFDGVGKCKYVRPAATSLQRRYPIRHPRGEVCRQSPPKVATSTGRGSATLAVLSRVLTGSIRRQVVRRGSRTAPGVARRETMCKETPMSVRRMSEAKKEAETRENTNPWCCFCATTNVPAQLHASQQEWVRVRIDSTRQGQTQGPFIRRSLLFSEATTPLGFCC